MKDIFIALLFGIFFGLGCGVVYHDTIEEKSRESWRVMMRKPPAPSPCERAEEFR